MTKLAYLQCPTGIAGDMCLGALVDIGVPLAYLQKQLQGLGIDNEYQLRSETVHRQGQIATKIHVDLLNQLPHPHQHRQLPEIEALINQANLPPRASTWSWQVFQQLAAAEAAVHGIAPEKVHFHEVGATDALVDIVGTCLGLDWLGIDQLYCSALPTGGGTVKAAHGILTVPAPAVLKLWQSRDVPVYSNGIAKELVTPTGAALVATLAQDFGAPPGMRIESVGLGAGSQDLSIANILQLWVGESWTDGESAPRFAEEKSTTQTIAVLSTQIDDLSPQAIAYTLEMLFQAGALDVFTQGIGMKKSRPGILLTAICPPDKVAACEAVIFQETTTLGIRRQWQERSILEREIQAVEIEYGTVRVKVASNGKGKNRKIVNVQPEYEDCAQLARQHHQSWQLIHRKALVAWQEQE